MLLRYRSSANAIDEWTATWKNSLWSACLFKAETNEWITLKLWTVQMKILRASHDMNFAIGTRGSRLMKKFWCEFRHLTESTWTYFWESVWGTFYKHCASSENYMTSPTDWLYFATCCLYDGCFHNLSHVLRDTGNELVGHCCWYWWRDSQHTQPLRLDDVFFAALRFRKINLDPKSVAFV